VEDVFGVTVGGLSFSIASRLTAYFQVPAPGPTTYQATRSFRKSGFGPSFIVQSYQALCRPFMSRRLASPKGTPPTWAVGVRVPAWSQGPRTR
jgi:hypothetical protein